MAADPRRVKDLFLAAIDIHEPAARRAFLDRESAGDDDLRRRVDVLLLAHDDPAPGPTGTQPGGGTAAYQPAAPTTAAEAAPVETVGTVVGGRYKLLEPIGEGGMGSVFMAQQTEPVKRFVAVKVIKAGMDSKTVLARFEAERQALALMDHPNIAKVLDAGATPAGRPYFVMELVKGVPITKFCDDRRLTPRQRLELFVPVCEAIQHAHQKGVIHRDIKPTNVLVALYDGRPVPKVIDFGVAKASGQPLTEKTLFTGFGAVVGTPEYMSPEQAEVNQLDIDTRSDVYALGVLLYELLTGTTPLDRKRLGTAALLEILRLVREEEPPRPSTRLSSSDALPSIAANRGTEPAKLTRMMAGELDWIVLKALEKDRGRRYETASGFARDIQRYLADELVEARPPSAGYRFRKFVRRNNARVASASLVVLALAAGIVGTTWQAAERRREREVGRLQSLQAAQSVLDRAEAALVANRLSDVDAALGLVDPQALRDDGSDLADRIESIRRDRDMVRELEEIYEQYWTVAHSTVKRDPDKAKVRYPDSFRRYGIPLGESLTDEAADRIRRARIGPALTDGLVTWFFLAPKIAGLRELLNRLDPDEFRTAVRAAASEGHDARLRELAKKDDASQQPPVFAVMLVSTVPDADTRRILHAAWRRYPDSFPVSLALSFPNELIQEEKDRLEQLGWGRTAVALRPNNALAHFYLSLALKQRSDHLGRIESLRRATELAPRFADAHAELGQAFIELDRYDEALASFRRAIEIDPVNVSAHVGQTTVYLIREDWVSAAAAWRVVQTLQLPPGDEGGSVSWALGFFQGMTSVAGGRLAVGLIQLHRFNDLVGLCVACPKKSFGEDNLLEVPVDKKLGLRRFYPACAAVQAAFGRGIDPPPLQDRQRIRRLALEWLSADLKTCIEKLAADSTSLRDMAHTTMKRWLNEPLLSDVRGDRITELPNDEQEEWKEFWKQVMKFRDQTAAPAAKR